MTKKAAQKPAVTVFPQQQQICHSENQIIDAYQQYLAKSDPEARKTLCDCIDSDRQNFLSVLSAFNTNEPIIAWEAVDGMRYDFGVTNFEIEIGDFIFNTIENGESIEVLVSTYAGKDAKGESKKGVKQKAKDKRNKIFEHPEAVMLFIPIFSFESLTHRYGKSMKRYQDEAEEQTKSFEESVKELMVSVRSNLAPEHVPERSEQKKEFPVIDEIQEMLPEAE